MQESSQGPSEPTNFEALYLRTPMMMHSIDLHGRLVAVSDFWLETLGYQRAEVIGRHLTDFFTPASRRFAEEYALPHFFQVGMVRDIPYQMVRKNGTIIDVLVSATAERDPDGAILRSMAGIVDVTERNKAEAEIRRLAHYDPLTGQPNRCLLFDRLQQALVKAERDGHKLGVMFVDLDRFKWVNDTLGHAAGDDLLKRVAVRLQECVRRSDTVARFGGDEFVVLLYGFDAAEEPGNFAQRFLDALSEPMHFEGVELFNTASIGIAVYPMDGRDVDTLLRNADIAMYAAKEQGRNTYQFFSAQMNERVKARLHLEHRLRSAMKNDELYLEYQPQIDLRNCRLTGFEVLVRWRDAEDGLVPPARFIPVAEESGLIHPLGEWVLRTACRQGRAWQVAGYPPVRIAVNISAKQLRRGNFVEMIEGVLAETGLPARHLEIEMTESVIMENIEEAITTLTDLKVRDVHLAIDDFGTGYSSLVYLKHFPFDRVKIAQEFIRTVPDDAEDMAIIQAILAMAASLRLDVIAEGVETRGHLDFLRARRCQAMQGYYFSPPLPAEEMTDFLRNGWIGSRACPYNSQRPAMMH